jgi:hypothetical protein
MFILGTPYHGAVQTTEVGETMLAFTKFNFWKATMYMACLPHCSLAPQPFLLPEERKEVSECILIIWKGDGSAKSADPPPTLSKTVWFEARPGNLNFSTSWGVWEEAWDLLPKVPLQNVLLKLAQLRTFPSISSSWPPTSDRCCSLGIKSHKA